MAAPFMRQPLPLPMPSPAGALPLPPLGGPPGMAPPGMGGPPPVMPMSGGMPPMANPGPDPMAAVLARLISDPDALRELADALEPEDDDPGPQYPEDYPRWYRKPPKPAKQDIETWAQDGKDEWRETVDRHAEDLEWFNLTRVGVFDPDAVQKKKDLAFTTTEIPDEVNLVAAILGGIPETYQVPSTDASEAEDTQKAEDFLYYAREEEVRRHSLAGNGPLRVDEVKFLCLYGRLVWRCVLDLEDDECPFREALLDPSTCFPVFGDRGLERMVRVYRTTIAQMLSQFDDQEGSLHKRFVEGEPDPDDDEDGYTPAEPAKRKLTDWVEVTEYHDSWWYACYADGLTVKAPVAHKLGYVPYVHQFGGLGEPNSADTPRLFLTEDEGESVMAGLGPAVLSRRSKAVSHFHYRKAMVEQDQMILGRHMTDFKITRRWPTHLYQDETAQQKGVREIGYDEADVTPFVKDHEEARPGPVGAPPHITEPLVQAVQQSSVTGRMPPTSYGFNANSNVTGNALEGLNEAGRDKLTPHILTLEQFHAQKAAMRLRMWRDWGHLFRGQRGAYGAITVPYQPNRKRSGEADSPAYELTPDVIERVGTKVQVKLTSLRLQNLAGLGNAAQVWIQGKMMSRREAMDLRGVRDPDATFDEIAYEDALFDQRTHDLRMMQALVRRAEGARDDPQVNPGEQSLAELMLAIFMQQMMQQGQHGQTQPGGGMQQAPMGGPQGGQRTMPNTSALNLQPYGAGAQTGGGRPPLVGPSGQPLASPAGPGVPYNGFGP
jgi:hypothetical protein